MIFLKNVVNGAHRTLRGAKCTLLMLAMLITASTTWANVTYVFVDASGNRVKDKRQT